MARDSMKSCCPWCFTRCTSLQICWKVTCGTAERWAALGWPVPGAQASVRGPRSLGGVASDDWLQGGRRERRRGSRLLTGAGGPGPSASPPLLSLEEPGLCRGPGDIRGPTPQSPVGLELCTGYSKEKDGLVSSRILFLTDHCVPRPSSTLTCSSSRWICSESSWMSESRDGAGLGAGGVKTSSFRGALRGCKGQLSPFPNPVPSTPPRPQRQLGGTLPYVRTLWRPSTKATLRLQGCTKPAQLVSMVTYSPLRAQKRIGEWSKGWPASCKTVGTGKKVGVSGWES